MGLKGKEIEKSRKRSRSLCQRMQLPILMKYKMVEKHVINAWLWQNTNSFTGSNTKPLNQSGAPFCTSQLCRKLIYLRHYLKLWWQLSCKPSISSKLANLITVPKKKVLVYSTFYIQNIFFTTVQKWWFVSKLCKYLDRARYTLLWLQVWTLQRPRRCTSR